MSDNTQSNGKPTGNFKAMALRRMSGTDFLALGSDKIVFVKPVAAEGSKAYGVYSASGEELGWAESFELAEATAFKNDFAVATLH
jgi:hypothetical protein